MAISIIGVSGQHKGQTFDFDNSKDKILFGRADEADVKFPSDLSSVSRFHLTLEFTNDRYRIRKQGDNPVFVDGRQVLDNHEIAPGEHEIALGSQDGPTFTVRYAASHDDMVITDEGYKTDKTWTDVTGTLSKALLVFVVIATGGYFYLNQEIENTATEIKAATEVRLAAVAEEVKGQLENIDTSNMADKVREIRKSVYFIIGIGPETNRPIGTAWVAGNGVLGTNSHVADVMSTLSDGFEMYAVSNQEPFTKHKITKIELHPDYKGFLKYQAEANRFVDSVSVKAARTIPGYDVALMWVDQPELLGPPIPLATKEDLAAMEPGDEIGLVGYPMENIAIGGVNFDKPNPQSHVGRLTNISDYFFVAGNVDRNHLIQVSLDLTGGASGSPVINKDGKVVALYNAGDIIMTKSGRISAGVGHSYAQRVDLLQELIEGQVESKQAARVEFWNAGFANFNTLIETLVTQWSKGQSYETLHKGTFTTKPDPNVGISAAVYDMNFTKAGSYFITAVSDKKKNLNMFLRTPDGQTIFKDVEKYFFTQIKFNHDGTTSVPAKLYVVSGDPDEKGEIIFGFIPK
jgi:hypothetical protein